MIRFFFTFVFIFITASNFKVPCDAWSPFGAVTKIAVIRPSQRTSTSKLGIGPQQLGEFEVLDLDSTVRSKRKVRLIDYSTTTSSPIPFMTAWDWQRDLLNRHIERIKGEDGSSSSSTTSSSQFWNESSSSSSGNINCGIDTILMLQHEPVYTLGTGSDEKFVLRDKNDDDDDDTSVPVVRMDRGGEVTYHGPGQLTVYPILDLRRYRQDIHWYMRALEEAILIALGKCNLTEPAERQADVTGVWVDNRKVAACGVKVRRWITMHGLAVNVETSSLENFNGIVPCGLDGRKVGCINQFVKDKEFTVAEFAEIMKQALEEVFEIELVPISHNS